MNNIIDTITKYKTKSADPIRDQQIAYIPRLEPDQIEYTTRYYILEGQRIVSDISNQLFIKLRYLKFRPLDKQKMFEYKSGVFDIDDLVNDGIITPFILFINGYFIPWELISVAIDNNNYHIIINAGSNEHYIDLCQNCNFAQIVTLPDYITCIKDYTGDLSSTIFTFNSLGVYSTSDIKYALISSNSQYGFQFNYWNTNSDVNAFVLLDNREIALSSDNIILFVDGLFSTGKREKLKRANDAYRTDDETDDSIYLDFSYCNDVIKQNPSISVESCILTINGGHNTESSTYDFGIFANPEYTANIDNASKIDVWTLAEKIKLRNDNGSYPRYLDDLLKPFEMNMDRSISYNENIVNSIKTIMQYDTSLLSDVIKSRSNLIIEEHTGLWAIKNVNDDGYIVIPMLNSHIYDEFIVMLVNGELYKYSDSITYRANKITIPIQDISSTDSIELLRFQNVNNSESQIIINESDGFCNYSSDIINNNMRLFAREYNGAAYEYPEDGLQHFEIDYTLETNSKGKIKITLTDPYYYGKTLTIAYKDRFKWGTFTTETAYDEYAIDLGSKFNYCPDYSKYLVFLNGQRLLSDQYRLVLPVRPTTPFYEFKIYLTIPVTADSRLDVIYIPCLLQDTVITTSMPRSGRIEIKKEILDHGFTSDTYMIWINGRKIPASGISDINSSNLKIIVDGDYADTTVCITKYIPSIDIINQIFDENISLWDSITNSMSVTEIDRLLGIRKPTIITGRSNTYYRSADIKTIMYELIRDQFICNPRVDITGPFVYDYLDIDTSATSGLDKFGNNILLTNDANEDDNSRYINREYP